MIPLSQQQSSRTEASSSWEQTIQNLQEMSLTGGVTYRRCHLQVIPQQYADIHQSTDLTKNNLHHRISYLYDDLLIKQDVPDKQAFVIILIILPVLSVVIIYTYYLIYH